MGEPPGNQFLRAASFDDGELAGQVYTAIQDKLRNRALELSVYRVLVAGVSHVVVLGEEPPDDFLVTVLALLAIGEQADLDPEVVQALRLRRREATKRFSWLEGHYGE